MKKSLIFSIGTLGLALAGCTNAGDPCSKNDECDSGYCVKINGTRQCAATCKRNNCSGNLECRHTVAGDTGTVGICLPASSKACGVCTSDSDCPIGAFCIPDGSQKYCLSDCGFTKECATGYKCEPMERDGKSVGMVCAAETGSCACDSKKVGNMRACYNTNAIGTCEGTETCDGTAWVGCDAPAATEEVCDGVDNDCDGDIDEQLSGSPLEQECSVNFVGLESPLPECTGGKEYCSMGNWSACTLAANHGYTASTMPKTEEFCDNLDDNCDGIRDNGLLGTGLYCKSCSDHCPPGVDEDGGTKHAISHCKAAEPYSNSKCQKATCEFPYFDVDGKLNQGWNSKTSDEDHYSNYNAKNNGCEVKDNLITKGDYKGQLNNTPEKAIDIGTLSKTGSKIYCDGYLPVDYKENHSEIAEGAEGYVDPTSAEGVLGGPMGVDYYTMKIGADMDYVDMYVTFTFGDVIGDDAAAAASIELSTLSGTATCEEEFAIADAAELTNVKRNSGVIKNAKKDAVILIKIYSKLPAPNNMPFPYHFGFVTEDSTGISASPIPLHACKNDG